MRQPKTPRTRAQWAKVATALNWGLLSLEQFQDEHGGYRRAKKGQRAKSGQWWRRERQPSVRPMAMALDADMDRCMTMLDEHSDSRP